MDIIRACAFTGHRSLTAAEMKAASDILRKKLADLIDNHGTVEFYLGGALGFDTAAAVALAHLKKEGYNGRFRMILACPHKGQEARWKPADKELYAKLYGYYDEVRCLYDGYVDGCMKERNYFMVDNCNLLIACCDPRRRTGGSFQTVNYAKKKGVPVDNLFFEIKDAAGNGSVCDG